MMPPATPTTIASTIAPKTSRPWRTAARPPLIPKTKVPARFRTRIRSGEKPLSTGGMGAALGREPRAGPGDERLHPGLERGVEHRREPRIVVRRQLREPALCLGPGIEVRVRAPNGPEHRGHMPPVPKEPKSSLADTGGIATTRSEPKCARRA